MEKSHTVKSILKAQTQGLVEDNVAVEATLVEQGRFTDALELVFFHLDITLHLKYK